MMQKSLELKARTYQNVKYLGIVHDCVGKGHCVFWTL